MRIYSCVLAFVTAFAITYYVLPSIIKIARVKGLTDEPGERRSHTQSTPSLGGVGIFAGILFSVIAWTPHVFFEGLQYVMCACIVVFLIGLKDDIVPSRPWTKVLGQVFAAAILVSAADVRIPGLFGIAGIHVLPFWVSAAITVFTIIVIINAFNLIDGVNGLTGTISIVSAAALGAWFYLVGHPEYTLLAAALIGSTMAFLKYNWTPAKIFMGDTGSLLLGLLMSVLTIRFLQFHTEIPRDNPFYFPAAPAAAIGFLLVPLFDTLRVFVTRAYKGRSPFRPDRGHIHHLFVDLGFSHGQTTVMLGAITVVFIAIVVSMQWLGNLALAGLIFSVAALATGSLQLQLKRRERAAEKKRAVERKSVRFGGANGAPTNGAPTNGKSAKTASVKGNATNGNATNGNATNGNATNGAATNGASAEGAPLASPAPASARQEARQA